MLNSYGMATYHSIDDASVWNHVSQPLKSGVVYMPEYASHTPERRGIACNRWSKSLYGFLVYQIETETKKPNKCVLKDNIFTVLYETIQSMFPSVEYCLAPKKVA